MVTLNIFTDADGMCEGVSKDSVVETKEPISIGVLKGGMTSGKPSVAIVFRLPEGKTVLSQISLALLQYAVKVFTARYGDMTECADEKMEDETDIPPVDRSCTELTSGVSVPEDRSHETIRPDGQQKAYVVLSKSERDKGFVPPFRDAYRHLTCGTITTMGRALAETYARDPSFYSGTFCVHCQSHFPVGEDGEFVWYEMDGTTGPKVGT